MPPTAGFKASRGRRLEKPSLDVGKVFQCCYMGFSQKVRRKWGIFFSLCKLGIILILFNSKQIKAAGRAFISKYNHLI